MNRKLTDFAVGLQTIMNRLDLLGLRPFVCDGSPLECAVFLVGKNPSTLIRHNFWTFWNDNDGFDKAAFLEAYQASRRRQGLALMSDTRYTTEWILTAAAPLKCLETNIYAASGTDLTERDKNTELFHYLLEQIKPKLVIAHGKVATKHLQAKPPECELKCVPHFSAQPGWFDMELIDILQRVRIECNT